MVSEFDWILGNFLFFLGIMTELHLLLIPTELFLCRGGGQCFAYSVLSSEAALSRFLHLTQNCLLTVRVQKQCQHCYFLCMLL